MAKTIHMPTFDAAEGTGMFDIDGYRYYVNTNKGIVTQTAIPPKVIQ